MNQVKQLITLLSIIVITSYTMRASSIKGYVLDKHTKEPIIGAIVSIPNQNLAVQTDIDGCFKIDIEKIGIEKIVIRSIGYKEHTRTLTINEKSNLDLGRIQLKRTHDKRYHRLMLSWNPSRTPNIASYSHNNLSSFVNFELAYGISASYLYGFNFYDNWALEFGAKYNYSWHEKTELATNQGYAEAKHHYVSVFKIYHTTFLSAILI